MGRKEDILHAARERFFRFGFKRTTINDIAGDVGIVKSAVYRHFKNKEDMLNAVIEMIAGEHMALAVNAMRRGDTAREKMINLFHDALLLVFGMLDRYKPTYELWAELRPMIELRSSPHHRQFEMFLSQILEVGIQTGEIECEDTRLAAYAMRISMDGIIDQVVMGELDQAQAKRFVDFIVNVLLDGLSKKG